MCRYILRAIGNIALHQLFLLPLRVIVSLLILAEVIRVSETELLLEVRATRLARHQKCVLVEPLPQVLLVQPPLVLTRHQIVIVLLLLLVDHSG